MSGSYIILPREPSEAEVNAAYDSTGIGCGCLPCVKHVLGNVRAAAPSLRLADVPGAVEAVTVLLYELRRPTNEVLHGDAARAIIAALDALLEGKNDATHTG